MNCNESDDDFSLRVKLRRHIRSRPRKPAPATCFDFFQTMIKVSPCLSSYQTVVTVPNVAQAVVTNKEDIGDIFCLELDAASSCN